jgi:hypothetical protein
MPGLFLPGRHEADGGAQKYLRAADRLAPAPKKRTGPRLREARSGFGCLSLVAVSAATGVSSVAGLLNNGRAGGVEDVPLRAELVHALPVLLPGLGVPMK